MAAGVEGAALVLEDCPASPDSALPPAPVTFGVHLQGRQRPGPKELVCLQPAYLLASPHLKIPSPQPPECNPQLDCWPPLPAANRSRARRGI